MKLKIKYKILLMTLSLVTLAVLLFSVVGIKVFKEDKQSYIFENILSRTEIVRTLLRRELKSYLKESFLYLNSSSLNTKKVEGTTDRYMALVSNQGELLFESSKRFSKEELLGLLNMKFKKGNHQFFIDGKEIFLLSKINKKQKMIALVSFSDLLDDTYKKSIYKTVVLDHRKNVIYTSNLDDKINFQDFDIAKNDSIIMKRVSSLSKSYLISSTYMKNYKLFILTYIDQEKAFQVIEKFVVQGVYFSGFLFFFSISATLLFVKLITGPIQKLIAGTQRVGEQNFSEQVIVNSNDELKVFADSFNAMQFKISKLLEEEKEKVRLESEIKVAQLVQDTLFLDRNYEDENCKLVAFYRSASECGGDWWTYKANEKFIVASIFDATGHGVGPALVTAAVSSVSSYIIKDLSSFAPKPYLECLNRSVAETSQGAINMTGFSLLVDLEKYKISYVNAGHIPACIYREKKWIRLNKSLGKRLGQNSNIELSEESYGLLPGDYIFIFTDGFTDLLSHKGTPLGEKRMLKKLGRLIDDEKDVAEVRNKLLLDIDTNYRKQEDDLSFILFRLGS